MALPKPKGKTSVTVFNFRDKTGQYKQGPVNSFSNAVTHGSDAVLMEVFNDSSWFIPLEREGLQNILTERNIISSNAQPGEVSNKKTGGAGEKYCGISSSEQY